ncbi:MAG: putative Zn-dependent protease [Paraglaciecola sp.]|jgi:predicted Zn-dependent protease
MNCKVKNIKISKERQFDYFKLALFSFSFFLFSLSIFAQDSIPANEDLTEEAELKFQQFFFKALSLKSIGNYQKAIENLENCNQLLINDVAVFFEFSKNYLFLNNVLLAKEYVNRALEKDAGNIWMLKHLVKIHQKDVNYKEAIKIQQKIIAEEPKEREFLVRLYVYDRQYQEAISLMNILESEDTLPLDLKRLKKSLDTIKSNLVKEVKLSDISSLTDQFTKDKSYQVLEQILKISDDKPAILLKYSDEGLRLFPAQPFVYLMKGKALNDHKSHEKALQTLQNGIDFVIEDKMEADFYQEIAKAYKGLGNEKEEDNYKQKAKKLKS